MLDLHGWIFPFSVSFLCIYFKSFYCCCKFCWCLLICFVIFIFRSQLAKSFLKVQSFIFEIFWALLPFSIWLNFEIFFLNFTQHTWTFCDDMNLTRNIWDWCTYKGRINRNRNMNILCHVNVSSKCLDIYWFAFLLTLQFLSKRWISELLLKSTVISCLAFTEHALFNSL